MQEVFGSIFQHWLLLSSPRANWLGKYESSVTTTAWNLPQAYYFEAYAVLLWVLHPVWSVLYLLFISGSTMLGNWYIYKLQLSSMGESPHLWLRETCVCWFWGRWIQLYWPVTTMSCHLIGREGGTVNADLFGRGTTITSPVHDWYKDSLKLKSARFIWHLRLQSKKDYDAALQANNLQYQKRGQDACLKMGMFFPRGQIVSPVSGLIFNVLLLCCMISVFLLLQQKVSGLVLNPPFIK